MSLNHITNVTRIANAQRRMQACDTVRGEILPVVNDDVIDQLIEELDWSEWEADMAASRHRADEVPRNTPSKMDPVDLAWDDALDLSDDAIDMLYEEYRAQGLHVYRD